jgi:hypothetical protein
MTKIFILGIILGSLVGAYSAINVAIMDSACYQRALMDNVTQC